MQDEHVMEILVVRIIINSAICGKGAILLE